MIYLPVTAREVVLSGWAGRPSGLSIDPIGVECVPRVRGAGRHPYLHVLAHRDLQPARIRAWQMRQVAQHLVRREAPKASGDELNRLTDDRLAALGGLAWTPATVVLDGRGMPVSRWQVEPRLWAAYAEIGEDRVALIGSDIPLDAVELRTASAEEALRLRTDAMRV